jgi:threonine dehydratase
MPLTASPSIHDIEDAAALLRGAIAQTPCIESPGLSAIAGARIWLKLENMQRTGSFKVRGAYVKLCSLTQIEREAGVVAVSAGNHAQGVACHGAQLGIATTIVMPKTTPYVKIRRTQALGARVLLSGTNLTEAAIDAQALAITEHLTMIHPYDDPHVIAGQGTVGLELIDTRASTGWAVPRVGSSTSMCPPTLAHPCASQARDDNKTDSFDAVVVPVGGGGLISGIAIALKALSPGTRIIGVQSETHPSLYRALYGTHAPAQALPTLAEGIAVKEAGAITSSIVREKVDEIVLVDEFHLERALHLLLEEEKTLAEGAGAAALAAVLRYPEKFAGARVALVVSGGNVDTGLVASVILRARYQEGRVVRLRVQIVDAPGSLAQISVLVAEHHANVLEVSHHRSFSGVPAKCAELDLTLELRSPADIDGVLASLRSAAFKTTLLDRSLAHA